jgi:hypothetical protein
MSLTENFYDQETGEYIVIEDGEVVARHQSILSKQERLTINRERAERLITQQTSSHVEEPLVQPEMFPESKMPLTNNGNGNPMPEMYPENKPVTNDDNVLPIPVLTWD